MFSSNTSQVSNSATYIEDVFSTYLYTGAGGAQTVSTGINLATYGGLLWNKNRTNAINNVLTDTARGANAQLVSNAATAQGNYGVGLSFLTNGFSFSSVDSAFNTNGENYVSWTFRKKAKFFDIVTYTGDGTSSRSIAHNLGSTPGCIIYKCSNSALDWIVYHSSMGLANYQVLNGAYSQQATGPGGGNVFGGASPTSTTFSVGSSGYTNANGNVYVAYLFASNAGGFGLTGTDNVITCGSYTGTGDNTLNVTLGYEPQYLLIKCLTQNYNWYEFDNMRGIATNGNDAYLYANTNDGESSNVDFVDVTATGFKSNNGFNGTNQSGQTYMYIAIRRGPMKVPTDATKVFTPIAATPSATASTSIAVTPDMFLFKGRNINDPFWTEDRLRYFALANTSSAKQLQVNSSAAEVTQLPIAYYIQNANMNWGGYLNGTASIIYNFKRAPSVFDEVCFPASTSTAVTLNHNLGVAPELIILKSRSTVDNWAVYSSDLGITKKLILNSTDAVATFGNNPWGTSAPTATTFTFNQDFLASSSTGVAYLFATCAGVSKVGSYTGTGSTQTINCGFTGGARFVLIRRTNASGSWWVWDTARGMVSGNDKRSALNTTASEVNADWVYTTTGGFQVVTSDAEVNASGSTYIFLAMA